MDLLNPQANQYLFIQDLDIFGKGLWIIRDEDELHNVISQILLDLSICYRYLNISDEFLLGSLTQIQEGARNYLEYIPHDQSEEDYVYNLFNEFESSVNGLNHNQMLMSEP